MLIGYARISTEYQNLNMQIDALKKHGVDERHIFRETISACARKRSELTKAMAFLKKGDTLVVYKLDRLGRSVSHLIEMINFLKEKGVLFYSITEKLETETATGKLLFNMMATLAEFERSLIQERVKDGMAVAKARGTKFGRKEILNNAQKEHIRELLKQKRSKYDIMRILGIKSRNPIYRLIKEEQL